MGWSPNDEKAFAGYSRVLPMVQLPPKQGVVKPRKTVHVDLKDNCAT
jgi:hypothetical protein